RVRLDDASHVLAAIDAGGSVLDFPLSAGHRVLLSFPTRRSSDLGKTRCGLTISASLLRRGSGMGTTPVLGSMVQNGKFSASIPALVRALKRVDLPTLGRPTIPQLNPMAITYMKDQVEQSLLESAVL